MNRKEALDAAASCVLQDRCNQYGPPEQSFGIISDLWSIILRPVLKEGAKVDPVQVALCMDALKTARLIVNPGHSDSWTDKIGYGACGAELATGNATPSTKRPADDPAGRSAIHDEVQPMS